MSATQRIGTPMNLQARSTFHAPDGRRHSAWRLGQICFPTDRADLDGLDREIITRIANYARPLSLIQRVELLVVGHADHRGGWTHNLRLGEKRALSVTRALSLQSHRATNLTVTSIVSAGETFAHQGAVSADFLAQDRRVDIWHGVPEMRNPTRPTLASRTVSRLASIEIEELEMERESLGDFEDDFGDALEKGADIFGKKYGRLGNRLKVFLDMGEIQGYSFAEVSPVFRVNNIRIEKKVALEVGIGTDTTRRNTKIWYFWGPPNDQVVVGTSYIKYQDLQFKQRHELKYQSKVLSRRQADLDPLYFPPSKDAFDSAR